MLRSLSASIFYTVPNFNVDYIFDTPLSDAYVANANAVLRERMMYGGQRLADLMVQIYGTKSNETEFLQ